MRTTWINGNPYMLDGYKIVVYTDGACRRNGYRGASAGIGVWFGEDHPLNVSEPLDRRLRCTNQVAELTAVRVAVELAVDQDIRNLKVFTDSRYVEGCVNVWRHKWESNGWVNSKKRSVENKEIIQRLCELADEDINLTVAHVPGHANVYGNEMADELANEGANEY